MTEQERKQWEEQAERDISRCKNILKLNQMSKSIDEAKQCGENVTALQMQGVVELQEHLKKFW